MDADPTQNKNIDSDPQYNIFSIPMSRAWFRGAGGKGADSKKLTADIHWN